MTGKNLKKLKVGRAFTHHTSPMATPFLFWVTGVLGVIAGLLRLLLARQLLLNGVVGSAPIIAATHLFTLAGFTMVMMGALYQLSPVLFDCEPLPFRRVFIQWAFYTCGVGLFAASLSFEWFWGSLAGAGTLVAGITLFVINFLNRVGRRSTWNLTAWFFISAVFYLSLTIIVGGLLAIHYTTGLLGFSNELPIHLTMALGGWFGLLMVGASFRLWNMFGRAHHEPRYWIYTAALAHLAIVMMVVGDFVNWSPLGMAGWALQIGAFILYGVDVARGGLFDGRTMKDPALKSLAVAMSFLLVFEVLGSLAWFLGLPELWLYALLAYGLGWVGMTFMGFVQKIVPFIVWLHRYAYVHGKGKMPRLGDILLPEWIYGPVAMATSGLISLLAGLALNWGWLLVFGIILEIGGWLLLLAVGVRAVRGPHRQPQ